MKVNKIINLEFVDNNLILIIDNRKYKFSLIKISRSLLSASEKERKNFIISPSGYGIHWSDIDEDLSIQALIKSYKKETLVPKLKKKVELR